MGGTFIFENYLYVFRKYLSTIHPENMPKLALLGLIRINIGSWGNNLPLLRLYWPLIG